jgi:hypothetical protein
MPLQGPIRDVIWRRSPRTERARDRSQSLDRGTGDYNHPRDSLGYGASEACVDK